MTDFLSGTFNIIPQSQAQWDADNRVLRSDTVALVTDGSNKGKHKIGRGAPYTFADLDYVEDGCGGCASSGIPMTFSSATSGAPAAGVFRFDSSTVGSIANGLIHMTAPTGVDNAGLWSLNNPRRGMIYISHAGGLLVMKFDGEGGNNGGVYEAPTTHVSGPLPQDEEECNVLFVPGPDEVAVPVVVVSGAGSAGADGNYYRNGSRTDVPMYRKGTWIIYKFSGEWIIEDADGNAYITTDSPANPWDGTWVEDTLSSPPPTVSEGTETLTIAEALSAALSLT